jgi:hypothetical protein
MSVVTLAIMAAFAAPAAAQQSSLTFNGTNQYVTFGAAPGLAASNFTVETWFKRTAAGLTTSTGAGGGTALGLTNVIPLVTKGRGEGDGGVIDCNYFLGIQTTPSVVLAADYEHDAASLNNHELVGTTVIQNNVWYHAAVTYDGTTLKIYLNGNLEAQKAASPAPRPDLTQHAGLATAMTSTGLAAGYFAGVLDEARIWNIARTQAQIQASMNTEVVAGTGLIGRWGLNEGSGTVAVNCVPTRPNGTLMAAPTWSAGGPVTTVVPADPSGFLATAATATSVHLVWTDNSCNEGGFEIERSTTGSGGPFSLLTTTAAGAVAYDDLGLTSGSQYCYRVRAANTAGGSGYAAASCATPVAPQPPADPTNLVATAFSSTQVDLTWSDNASNETGFEVERSTTGSAGTYTPLASLGANSTSYSNTGLTGATQYCYRVRAMNGSVPSGYAGSACATTSAASLDLGSAHAYVNFGNAASLNLSAFTLETWVRRDAVGVGATTGTGGISDAVPLIAKGTAEAETQAADVNYLFGIRQSTGVLCADFEEAQSGTAPGLNHPVYGATALAIGAWHHVAATYDGTTWKLYLDGVLDGSLGVGKPANNANIAPAVLGTGVTTTGTAIGFFDGAMDEVRIWNYARSASEIYAAANSQISSATTGLVARWALDEGTGTAVSGSAGTTVNGTISGTGSAWTLPAPFNVAPAPAPAAPGGLAATAVTQTQVHVAWTDNASTETGFELERSTTGAGGPFTLLASLAANTVVYDDNSVSAGNQYCYQVRAVNGGGASSYAAAACATTASLNTCLDFEGASTTVNAYVNAGNLAALHLPAFTVEAWIRRDGAGVGNTTGANGVDSAVPIMAKGMAEVETADADYNYFLGIQSSTGLLVADFEEGQTGTTPGANHPIYGTTPIPADSTWHHVAATYDGTTWNLYLDGVRNAQLAVGQPVANVGISPASIGSALTTVGAPLGFFNGRIDEARVWDSARTEAEIQNTINSQLSSATAGLVARWGMNEGTGTSVGESAGGVAGTIVGTYYSWQPGAPFNWSPPSAPSAPTGLAATACSQLHVDVSWTDNSTSETGFEVERATSSGGPYTLVGTAAANATTYSDVTVSASTQYYYRVRAAFGATPSGYAGPASVMTPATGSNALDLGGVNAWANFGNPAALNLTAFTLEMWVRREGAGTGTNTGTGGIADAVPLLAKGRADAETQAADINYLFAIQQSTGLLCADFEEAQTGTAPSLNHPILGATPLVIGTWYHVAATYDGTSWKLYVNGALDASADVGQPVNNANTVSVSLGTALTTASVAGGFFDGSVDEVRIWNYAREQAQIQANADEQITSVQSGLVARWSMDEGTGTALSGSAGTTVNGTLTGTYGWGCGTDAAPLNLTFPMPPLVPVLVGPADGGTGVSLSPSLSVAVSDPNGDPVTVTWYGRPTTGTPGPDFTLVGFPDTQNYTSQAGTSSNFYFKSQMNWVVANRTTRNIAYAVHLGDCTEHGNNTNNPIEWMRADTTMKILENPATTGLTDGIPYGLCVGNHDQSPIGIDLPDTTTRFYNQFFGTSRFSGRGYYGGHYGTNNDSWYDLFSASGMDFIVIGIEYEATADAAVLAWADQLLTTYSSRRAIIASHFVVNTGNPGGFGPQGQAIYNALKGHSNLFLMLCGHVPGEGRRQDTYNGNTVNTLLSDYQSYANGGNGFLRYMEFSPANNVIRVRTYSPVTGQYEADSDSSSQFTLPYVMSSTSPFQALGSSTVPSGTTASLAWPGRTAGAQYEWYAEVTDGTGTRTSPVWSFTTSAQASYAISATAGAGGSISPSGSVVVVQGASQSFAITPTSGYTVSDVLVDGASQGAITSYTFNNVQAGHTIAATFSLIPVDVVAAAVTPGTVISGAHACVDVPVTYTRTSTTGVRAYSVRVRFGGGLAACGASFTAGDYLSSVGTASFNVADNHDGSYDIAESILGVPCGATGSGTLFTVHVGSASASGTGTITIDSVRVRDCANALVPGDPGPVANVAIDNTPPAAPTEFAAQQSRSGNGSSGTTAIALTWTAAVEPGGHVEVWRKGYGNYPEYDDGAAPGAIPGVPAAYPPSGWTQTTVTSSGQTDTPASRDTWFYVAYAVDAAGNAAASARTDGTLDYSLGDVANGAATCVGDNVVNTADISALGEQYGTTLGEPATWGCLDVGPTSTGYVDGRPLTDNRIDFEDLVLFSLNYGQVSAPLAASRPAPRTGGSGTGGTSTLGLTVGETPAVGGTFTAVLSFTGSGDVQALSARLAYDATVVEPVSVTGGSLLGQQAGPAQVFTPGSGQVDAAVFGRGLGLAGSGELARVTFRVKGAGDPGIALGAVQARDQGNRAVELGRQAAVSPPVSLALAPSYPNPFTSATTVVYGMPRTGPAKLVVFDIQGRAVRHLVDGAVGAGWQRVTWDAHDDAGNSVAPGSYVIRLSAAGRVISRSVRLVR